MRIEHLALTLFLLPAVVSAECNHLYVVPFVEPVPGEAQLAIASVQDQLEALGVVEWTADEVGGNQAVVCLIMEPEKSKLIPGEGIDQLMTNLGASHIDSRAELRALYNVPLYRRMLDASGNIVRRDGRDGRPLERITSDPSRIGDLRERAKGIRERRLPERHRDPRIPRARLER